nr:TolC family protein [Parasedimentitalea psychrophila]
MLAVEEVRNSMFALHRHQRAIKQAALAEDATRKVLVLARQHFLVGEANFLQVQDAERSSLAAENSLALDRRNLAIDYVPLNIALGGIYRPAGGLM